ncbi:hypothetical protein EDB85DRAFT_2291638 [Lactarius pseudohatsudake]|nr:hypothetical protein EDB85DRAFT_2291638 [Lactarius pseudohatsudake]
MDLPGPRLQTQSYRRRRRVVAPARPAGMHTTQMGPMFGSVIPEPDGVDHGPGAVVRAHASPGQGLNFDLASPNPAVLGWNDWRYAGDGTIDPSVLGAGGNNSPDKLGDSPVHEFGDDGCARHSRATDKDKEEEEEDVVGLFLGTRATTILRRRRGLGKGKGRAVVNGVVESPEYDDDGCDGDDDVEIDEDEGPRTHVISAPVFTGARRKKRMPASSSRAKPTPDPMMRCTLLKASTDEQCRDLFHDLCIEKQHPELTFNRPQQKSSNVWLVTTICNQLPARRGNVPERDGGRHSWVAPR